MGYNAHNILICLAAVNVNHVNNSRHKIVHFLYDTLNIPILGTNHYSVLISLNCFYSGGEGGSKEPSAAGPGLGCSKTLVLGLVLLTCKTKVQAIHTVARSKNSQEPETYTIHS